MSKTAYLYILPKNFPVTGPIGDPCSLRVEVLEPPMVTASATINVLEEKIHTLDEQNVYSVSQKRSVVIGMSMCLCVCLPHFTRHQIFCACCLARFFSVVVTILYVYFWFCG